MRWPFVSRGRFEDLEKRYDELKQHSDRVLEIILAEKPPEEKEDPRDTKRSAPHRPMIADVRSAAETAARAGRLKKS